MTNQNKNVYIVVGALAAALLIFAALLALYFVRKGRLSLESKKSIPGSAMNNEGNLLLTPNDSTGTVNTKKTAADKESGAKETSKSYTIDYTSTPPRINPNHRAFAAQISEKQNLLRQIFNLKDRGVHFHIEELLQIINDVEYRKTNEEARIYHALETLLKFLKSEELYRFNYDNIDATLQTFESYQKIFDITGMAVLNRMLENIQGGFISEAEAIHIQAKVLAINHASVASSIVPVDTSDIKLLLAIEVQKARNLIEIADAWALVAKVYDQDSEISAYGKDVVTALQELRNFNKDSIRTNYRTRTGFMNSINSALEAGNKEVRKAGRPTEITDIFTLIDPTKRLVRNINSVLKAKNLIELADVWDLVGKTAVYNQDSEISLYGDDVATMLQELRKFNRESDRSNLQTKLQLMQNLNFILEARDKETQALRVETASAFPVNANLPFTDPQVQ